MTWTRRVWLVSSTTRQPCAERPRARLTDADQGRSLELLAEPDGTLWADGVLPGTYHVVEVECAGHVARAPYAPVVIADRDATGLVWELDPGATLRGKVLTRAGAAVADADVRAGSRGGAPRAQDTACDARTREDGSYELTGLRPGSHQVFLTSSDGIGPLEGYAVEIPAGGVVTRDLVLDDGGAIAGRVVDASGAPVPGVWVRANAVSGHHSASDTTNDAGAFRIAAQPPGRYRVVATRSVSEDLRKPGPPTTRARARESSCAPGRPPRSSWWSRGPRARSPAQSWTPPPSRSPTRS